MFEGVFPAVDGLDDGGEVLGELFAAVRLGSEPCFEFFGLLLA